MDSRKIQHTPREIQQFRSTPCQLIAAGDFHTTAVDSLGIVYSWGYGLEGQCGNGSTMNIRTPRQLVFPEDGIEITDLSCGSAWTFALTSRGELYTWGYGDGGWLGIHPPEQLPYVESELPPPPLPRGGSLSDNYYFNVYTRSFDSELNVLRPCPVAMAADRYVKWTRCGGGHAIFCIGIIPGEEGGITREEEEAVAVDTASPKHTGRNRGADMKSARGGAPSARRGDSETPRAVMGSGRFGYTSLTEDSPNSSREEQLMSWVRHKKVPELTHALANAGADVNTRDKAGNTPMIVACQNGHLNVCKILVEYGASLSLANKRGNTALHYCFAYGFNEIGEYLISCGADEYAQNSDGLTCYEGLCAADLEKF
jgi:hypothetical protein